MIITVRYFGGAVEAAGTDQELLETPSGSSLSTLVDLLRKKHGEQLARILDAASFLVEEVSAPPERPLEDAETVDVLPPFAGG